MFCLMPFDPLAFASQTTRLTLSEDTVCVQTCKPRVRWALRLARILNNAARQLSLVWPPVALDSLGLPRATSFVYERMARDTGVAQEVGPWSGLFMSTEATS